MRLIQNSETGEVQRVTSTEGYDETWIDRGDLPPDVDPMCLFWGDEGFEIDLGPLKRAKVASVNSRAEAIRNLYLTPGSGQAITYARKENEARAFDPGGDPSDTPFLYAEAVSTGATLADTAALVLAQANAWVAIGAAIEGNRRGLVVAIEAAADAEELNGIDTTSGWPGGE